MAEHNSIFFQLNWKSLARELNDIKRFGWEGRNVEERRPSRMSRLFAMPFGDIRMVERRARTTRHQQFLDLVERVLARK